MDMTNSIGLSWYYDLLTAHAPLIRILNKIRKIADFIQYHKNIDFCWGEYHTNIDFCPGEYHTNIGFCWGEYMAIFTSFKIFTPVDG